MTLLPTPPLTRRATAGLCAVLLVLVVAGCSPQTAGTPEDGRTFTVELAHVENLVPGHSVRIADVVIGTVTAIELTSDLRAEVTLVVEPDVELPEGTVARLRKTSLLGEDFIALEYPSDLPAGAPTLAEGAVIPVGGRVATVEEVVEQAIRVLGALSGDDLSSLISNGVEIVDGREDQLRAIIEDVGLVTSTYADQTERIGQVVDGIADLGAEFAAGREELVEALDNLADGVEVGAAQRDRVVNALAALDRVRSALDGGPLGEYSDEFREMLDELGGAAGDLAVRTDELTQVLEATADFVARVPLSVNDEGEFQLYIIMQLQAGGQPVENSSQLGDLLEPPS